MKKFILSLIISLVFVVNVWSATYYINQSTGNNSNDGSSSTPWKDIYHADSVVASSDVVDIIATQTAPYRGNINNTTATVTYQGTNKAYILGSIDISQGAAIGDRLKNSDLNSWSDGETPFNYIVTETGDSDITRESTIIRSGYSAKFDRVSSGTSTLRFDIYLEASTEYTFTFWHYDTVSNNRIRFTIREDLATDNYLQANGTWSTSAYTYDDVGTSVDAWQQYSITFTSNAAGRYFFTPNHGYDNESYIDDISVVPTTNTYAWSQYSGDTYQLTIGQEVKVLAKCSDSAWSSGGVLNLSRPVMGSDKDTLNAGEWFWESGVLYYKLNGEAIADIHFEGSQPLEYPTAVNDVVTVSTNDVVLDNLWAGCGANNNYNITGAITGVTATDCDSFAGGKDNSGNGWSINTGASATLTDCTGKYDGIKAFYVTASTAVLNRCIASYGWSGGVYSHGGATVTAKYCIAKNNGREGAADNSGFNAHSGAANNLTLYHCTSINNYGRGISVAGSGTVIVKNCIGYNTTSGANSDAHIDAGFSGSFTHTNNMFGGYYSAGWTPDATELTGDPKITSVGKLRKGSPCKDTAVLISGVNDSGQTDPWGKHTDTKTPNIGADQRNVGYQSIGGENDFIIRLK